MNDTSWSDLRGRFPFLDVLEAHTETFLRELAQLSPEDFVPMPSAESYAGTWLAFPLHLGPWAHEFHGVDLAANRARCPETAAVLDTLEHVTVGGFLMLEPGGVIKPHADIRDDDVIRAHLGLRLAPHERETWAEGTARVMDIRMQHEARNEGDTPRITLMVDVRMPFAIPTGVLPVWGAPQ